MCAPLDIIKKSGTDSSKRVAYISKNYILIATVDKNEILI